MVSTYVIGPAGRKRVPPALVVATTLGAALITLSLPRADIGASVWVPLIALFPDSAQSCFALAVASLTGCVAWQAADAVGRRSVLRPALTVILIAVLLTPATISVPLWPGLIAAAALLALPAPVCLDAANDNPAIAPRTPFSLAA